MKKPFYGWVIVGVTFLIGATEVGAFQNILSIFMKPMAETFGWTRAAVSGAIAFGSICAGAVSPFAGQILDRQGPRMLAFLGILILSAGLIGMSFVTQIWQLYLFFGVGRMVAVGGLSLVISVTVSNWFIRLRGRAMGITWLGPRFGAAILPALAQFFILSHGWRYAWAAVGIIVFLISGIPSLVFLRRRPEDMGLLPDGRQPWGKGSESAAPGGKSGTEPPAPETEPVWTRAQAVRTRAFWILTVISSLAPFAQAGINFNTFPFLTDHGIPEVSAVLILSTIAVFGAVGAVVWGVLAERVDTKLLLAVNGFASGCVFLGLFWAVRYRGLFGLGTEPVFFLAAVHGLLHGGRLPILSIIWADFYGRSALGSIYGLASPFRFAANACGPIFAALFFDITGSYQVPFYLFVVIFLVLGGACMLVEPPHQPTSNPKSRGFQ